MHEDPSRAWTPAIGETVRIVKVGALGRVAEVKAGRYGPEVVIHIFTRVGQGGATVASPPDRAVCTPSELAPHETSTGYLPGAHRQRNDAPRHQRRERRAGPE